MENNLKGAQSWGCRSSLQVLLVKPQSSIWNPLKVNVKEKELSFRYISNLISNAI